MLESADVQLDLQGSSLTQHEITFYDLENKNSDDFSGVLSPFTERKVFQGIENITPNNKRKLSNRTESPPKRCKNVLSGSAQIQPLSTISQESSPMSSSTIDTNPGGGQRGSGMSERLNNTLIIIDWDDTLFPSSYLSSLDVDYDTKIIPQCLMDRIFILETHVLDMLNFVISKVGERRVCIITNAEKGWITLSGQKFMPRLLQRIYKCKMLSARSTFEPFAPSSGPLEWKVLAFHMVAEMLFGARFPKPVVHVMKPREIVSVEKRAWCEMYGDDDSFDDDSSETLSEDCDTIQDVVIDHLDDSKCLTETVDDFTDTSSEYGQDSGCYNVGRQGLSLSATAAGIHSHNSSSSLRSQSASREFFNSPNKTQTFYLPSDEIIKFPEVPTNYLEHSGFDYVPAEDANKVLRVRKYMVSLGDSLAEKLATQHVANAIPNTLPKTVKYMERPNIDQLVSQTIAVRNKIQEFLEVAQALDVVINIPDRDMMSFEQQFWTERTYEN